MADDETFGARLRRLRKAAGLTLAEMGADLGLSAPYLSDVERGRRAPLLPETIAQLVNALGVDAVRELHAVGRPESRITALQAELLMARKALEIARSGWTQDDPARLRMGLDGPLARAVLGIEEGIDG